MSTSSPESPKNLQLSDFVRTEGVGGAFVSGINTPDQLTRLRQAHEAFGNAPLDAQLEIAWQYYDDETVSDIVALQDPEAK